MTMTHDAHEAYPRYSPEQVLKDGCGECAQRSAQPALAISKMDPQTFVRAWARSVKFANDELPDVAAAEVPVLDILWAVRNQLPLAWAYISAEIDKERGR